MEKFGADLKTFQREVSNTPYEVSGVLDGV